MAVAPDGLRAALLMLGSTLGTACSAAIIRHISADLHPFELVFFRNLFGLLTLAPWIVGRGWRPFRTRRYGLTGLRVLSSVTSLSLFYTALAMTPLARVMSLLFAAPLFATLFAIAIMGDRVGPRRGAALLVGFGGTLIILRPGVSGLDIGAVMALGSAATFAMTLTFTKLLSRTDSSLNITVLATVLMMPVSLFLATFVWRWPAPHMLLWLAAMGISSTLAQLSLTQSLRLADSSAVLPLDFAKLIWAALIGFIVFAETPDLWTWIGGVVIFVMAIYVTLRESRTGAGRTGVTVPPP